jgi:hypothetical protein
MDQTTQVAIVFLAAVAPALFGQDANRDATMMRADRAFAQALAKADKSALDKLLDVDFTWTNTEGQVQTKAQVLRELPKAAIPNAKDAESKAYTYGDLGNVQVNLGRAHVLRVWVKQPSGWKALVYQELMSR